MGGRRNISLPTEYDPLIEVVAAHYGSFSAFIRISLDAVARSLRQTHKVPRGLDLELGILKATQEATSRRIELEQARQVAADTRIQDLLLELDEARQAARPARQLSVQEIVRDYAAAPEQQLRRLAVRNDQDPDEVVAAVRVARAAQTTLHVLPADKGVD